LQNREQGTFQNLPEKKPRLFNQKTGFPSFNEASNFGQRAIIHYPLPITTD